jgi:hypothetical protein
MSKSKIQFIADTKEMLEVLERPYPAIQKLPDWISNIPSYIGGHKGVDEYQSYSIILLIKIPWLV